MATGKDSGKDTGKGAAKAAGKDTAGKRGAPADNTQKSGSGNGTPAKRGFAAMDENQQREIASKGGQAAHQKGTAHEFDSEEARRAGQKGGEAVSRDREHMADIGRKGGESRQSAARIKEGGSAAKSSSRQGGKSGE